MRLRKPPRLPDQAIPVLRAALALLAVLPKTKSGYDDRHIEVAFKAAVAMKTGTVRRVLITRGKGGTFRLQFNGKSVASRYPAADISRWMLRRAECPYIVNMGMKFEGGHALLYHVYTREEEVAARNRATRRFYHPGALAMRAKYAQVKKAHPGVFN